MIIYNPRWLNNLFTREQAATAFDQGYLRREELDLVNNKYPVNFYSPNFFIRIGLFILTVVVLLFSFGLFSLLFLTSLDNAIGGLAIFFALVSYAILELMVRSKNHFRSGVDDALMWISAGSLFGGISYLSNAGGLANCVLVFVIALFCSLRFADRVMGILLYVSFLGILFFACIKLGNSAKAFVPFVLMIISGIIYLLIKKTRQLNVNQLYHDCLQVISVAALLGFYISGNYYVVRELSNSMFNLNLAANESIPLGWFFWLFTVIMPCIYIGRGIQKKDITLIRVGLLLIAAMVFTIRYYYSVAPLEVIMTAGGIVLVLVAYGLSRYLKAPQYGFTNEEIRSIEAKEKLHIESILVAQAFGGQQDPAPGTSFGGGSFGGGGASGEF
ncbi:MAG: hypothetical protein ABIQ31_07485 [Ferruginibacter sp.]